MSSINDKEAEAKEEEARIRYDRQVRLWGSGVQQRLHSTVLIVIGSICSIDETLKNLVLAGVGKIRIALTSNNNNNLSQSVVALCGSEIQCQNQNQNNNNNNTMMTKEQQEKQLVEGFRRLNNLVDAAVFDSKENFPTASCVMCMLVEPGSSSSFSELKLRQDQVDIFLHARFLTKHYALCEFESKTSAASSTSSSSIKQTWHVKSTLPPLAALLNCASNKANNNNNDKEESFVELTSRLIQQEPEAVSAVDPKVIEKVAAEVLQDQQPTIVLNSVLGGVLSQQVLAHVCAARGAFVVSPQSTSEGGTNNNAPPSPMNWVFVSTQPSIECFVG